MTNPAGARREGATTAEPTWRPGSHRPAAHDIIGSTLRGTVESAPANRRIVWAGEERWSHMKADAPGPSAEDEAGVVSLLRRDVEATIGPGHDGRIIEAAARRRRYNRVRAEYVGDVVDDVQQHVHDTFVDTTWPACPHHPNHPLWFSDGWWRCERIEEPIARLGALSGVNQEREG
jgi:hypothetical protein